MSIKTPITATKRPTTETVIAEKNRAKVNRLDDSQRSTLFAKAMQLMYGVSFSVSFSRTFFAHYEIRSIDLHRFRGREHSEIFRPHLGT